jgi:hypothetical protein
MSGPPVAKWAQTPHVSHHKKLMNAIKATSTRGSPSTTISSVVNPKKSNGLISFGTTALYPDDEHILSRKRPNSQLSRTSSLLSDGDADDDDLPPTNKKSRKDPQGTSILLINQNQDAPKKPPPLDSPKVAFAAPTSTEHSSDFDLFNDHDDVHHDVVKSTALVPKRDSRFSLSGKSSRTHSSDDGASEPNSRAAKLKSNSFKSKKRKKRVGLYGYDSEGSDDDFVPSSEPKVSSRLQKFTNGTEDNPVELSDSDADEIETETQTETPNHPYFGFSAFLDCCRFQLGSKAFRDCGKVALNGDHLLVTQLGSPLQTQRIKIPFAHLKSCRIFLLEPPYMLEMILTSKLQSAATHEMFDPSKPSQYFVLRCFLS